MDKLDLDARMTRVERRVGFLTTVLLLAGLGLAALTAFGLVARRHSPRPPTVIASPLPPTAPPMVGEAVPVEMPGDMMGQMPGMMDFSEGSMSALYHRLGSLAQLHGEGLITAEEWQAMKARALEGPIAPGDLRSDLRMVQDLSNSGAISDAERAEIRAKLLEIGE